MDNIIIPHIIFNSFNKPVHINQPACCHYEILTKRIWYLYLYHVNVNYINDNFISNATPYILDSEYLDHKLAVLSYTVNAFV